MQRSERAEPGRLGSDVKKVVRDRSFWILAAMLVGIALLHYLTPQVRFLSPDDGGAPLTVWRHAAERIIFILPVAGATFAFGQVAGLITLALAVAIMLPRVFLISPYPGDALLETAAVAVVGYLVTWIIEVQEREKTLRQDAVSRLRTIGSVTSIVTESLQLEQILNRALDSVLDVTQVETGRIYLLDAETGDLILAAHRGLSPEVIGELARFDPGHDLVGQVGQMGEPVIVDNLMQDSQSSLSPISGVGMRSLVAVPLRSRDRAQGVLSLCHTQQGRFGPPDLQLLAPIGDAIGVAVENARLHQDVARQLRIQQRLNEAVTQITSELELDRILPKVLQIAKELVGADGGLIALLDQDRNLVHYPYLHNLPQRLAQVTVPTETGLAGEVATTCQPIVVRSYPDYPRAIPAFVEAGVTSSVAVPIVGGEQCFGALSLVSLSRARSFSERDLAILTALGQQAGIAIANARLYETMRFYARQISQAQEDERRRIARELHDETIQTLIAVSRRLEAMAATVSTLPVETADPALQQLGRLQELLGDATRGVRRFVQDLRPPALDHLGLVAALEGTTADLVEKDGLEASLHVQGETRRLAPEEELVLFRIAQEALSNVRRHSGASRVEVELEFLPQRVRMVITDNGHGFSAPERISDLVTSGRLGLIGMHERARLLGGTLQIQSGPGRGRTTVTVDVPLQARSEGTPTASG